MLDMGPHFYNAIPRVTFTQTPDCCRMSQIYKVWDLALTMRGRGREGGRESEGESAQKRERARETDREKERESWSRSLEASTAQYAYIRHGMSRAYLQ